MSKERFQVTLAWSKELNPRVRHFALRRRDGADFSFIPGQFISLHWQTETGEIKRSYSVASREHPSPVIELAASFVDGGFASRALFALQDNDVLEASGPYGRLTLPETITPETRLILIGTGTGITPYRSMLNNLKHYNCPIIIAQGVQTREQLLYTEEFLAFANSTSRASFYACLSRELSALNAHERKGYVQSIFAECTLDPRHDIVYLCGNPNMIDEAFELLRAHGFESSHVRREKYISGK